jgi:hypothetical protein
MSNPTSVPLLAHRVDELKQAGQSEADVERQLARYLREHELTDEEIREKIVLVSEFITRREAEIVDDAAQEAQMSSASQAILGAPSTPSERARGKRPDPLRSGAVHEEVQNLRALVQSMTARMDAMMAFQATSQANSAPTPSISEPSPARGYHTKFPDPEAYNGDRKSYRHWRIQVQHKIASEQARGGMGDPEGYIFSRLKGDAARAAITYMERGAARRPGGLWNFLDAQYLDPIMDEKARDKLYTFRQGKSSLTEYIQEFNRLMYEADEQGNTPALKSRFRIGLREDLRDKMVAVEIPREWSLERLQERVRGIEENMFRNKIGRHSGRHGYREDQGEPMEDVRTKLHETRFNGGDTKKRAEWVTPEVLEHRRTKELCLRCGNKDHRARNCKFARAIRPTQVNATSARVNEYSGDSSTDGAESEN